MVCRLEQGEALEHPRRRVIYDAIKAEPGQNFRALSKRLGIPAGTLSHHLMVLWRSGLIWCANHGCRRRHFPGQKPPTEELVQRELARHGLDELDRRMLAAVGSQSLNQKAFIDQFPELPRSSVQWRLGRLARQGFLVVRHIGRRIVYHAGVTP